ncbi:MAG: Txe/YoeB family addiction module toxin [Planctomycetaceae bacterium]|jgi:toxin YoeB|nr:Txe/YoeB family addiction module toxin [Planctomycetaceae bacterium]
MLKLWCDNAWEAYVEWQTKDKKLLKRINQIIKEMERTPYEGIGKPEPLKGDLSGYWSRRIDDKNRIVYKVANEQLIIIQCGTHYGD